VDLIPTYFCSCSVGHHSTSDDSYKYRARTEVEDRKRIDNPIARFKLFLESQGWWNDEEEEHLKARLRKDVLEAFKKAEGMKRNNLGELFSDVYGGEEPWNIVGSSPPLVHVLETYAYCRGSNGKSWRRY
jgi:2-oxoisovalerate dehydrogenase E1 component alpha subunit